MHSLNHNIIPDDNDIDHRTADSAAGYDARLSLRVFHEGRDVREITENIAGFRIGCDGGCIGMVAADSCNGDGGR